MNQTLRERKDEAAVFIIQEPTALELTDFHKSAVRRRIYGRTHPRPGLCLFDALGMDIIEGRA